MMLHGVLSAFRLIEDKGPLLYQAIKDGNKDVVNEILSGPLAPSYSRIRNPAGESEPAAVLAAGHPEPDILIKLLEMYKNGIRQHEKYVALRDAAQNGYTAIVSTLLDRCGNEIDAHGKGEALKNAAQSGHTAIVITLLERCGNEISPNHKGWTLLGATQNAHTAIVATLLERCDNEISAHCKRWALPRAAENGHTAIVTTLLDRCGGEIDAFYKGLALRNAAQNGHLNALNALLANESVLALAASDNNGALRAAQMERNGTDEGSEERARYDAVIARLMAIPAVAQLANQQANQENDPADIANFRENSMQDLTKNESALVNHLKKHYEPVFQDKSWEVIRIEILSYLESEYQKSPAEDGHRRIWMLESGARKPAAFIPADTIGLYPCGDKCEVSWKSLDGTLNQKTVLMSEVKSIYTLLSKEPSLHQESQDAVLVEAIINGLGIPAHPHQGESLPLEHTANLHESALTAYYRHPVHNAWRYLSNNNPWMSPQADYVEVLENGLRRAIVSNTDKELISYFWLALCDELVTLERGFTFAGNKSIFAATIAELNRGHNCDERALYVGSDETTHADDLQADRPSCSYGVTKRLLQSEYGHPYINCPTARPLSLEIIRERMESLLIQSKLEEAAPDNLIDRLNKLDKKELTFVQQQLSDICCMFDYDESDKIILNETETAQVDSVINTPREQLDRFIEGAKLWFSKERIEQEHDNPKLSTGPGASDFFKDHTSYVAFIEACAQRPLVAFSEALWKAVSAQLETMSSPAPIVNQYARVNKKRKNEERDPCNNDEPDHKKRKPSSP